MVTTAEVAVYLPYDLILDRCLYLELFWYELLLPFLFATVVLIGCWLRYSCTRSLTVAFSRLPRVGLLNLFLSAFNLIAIPLWFLVYFISCIIIDSHNLFDDYLTRNCRAFNFTISISSHCQRWTCLWQPLDRSYAIELVWVSGGVIVPILGGISSSVTSIYTCSLGHQPPIAYPLITNTSSNEGNWRGNRMICFQRWGTSRRAVNSATACFVGVNVAFQFVI